MKLNFIYNRDRDVWCLLNKGPSSSLSSKPTEVYKIFSEKYKGNINEKTASLFIDEYFLENNINVDEVAKRYKKDFDKIGEKFIKIAEGIFGLSLKKDITVYLTINNRCPYSIEENYYFVYISKDNQVRTSMHELWHFYTWYKFGLNNKYLSGSEYNDLKEALTVLLNVKCGDLLPTGVIDHGYTQHENLRNRILSLWKEKEDIDFVWNKIIEEKEIKEITAASEDAKKNGTISGKIDDLIK